MAAGIETRIFDGLNAWLAALVFSPAIPIAWPNLAFTPNGAYLRPWLLPARTEALAIPISGPNEHAGIFQVSVFWPTGQGATTPMERASAIAVHFKRGTKIDREGISVRIDAPPWVGPMIQEADVLQLPVSIPYRAFAPNP